MGRLCLLVTLIITFVPGKLYLLLPIKQYFFSPVFINFLFQMHHYLVLRYGWISTVVSYQVCIF